MNKQICVRCGQESPNGLPLCGSCRDSLRDFKVLAEYLNSFKGRKEDLLYILTSEISNRQTNIINSCDVVTNFVNGTIEFIAKEPSSTTLKQKPWLWDRYLNIQRIIDEIKKLRKALSIAEQFYGGEEGVN